MKIIYGILLMILFLSMGCSRNKNKVHYEYEPPDSDVVEENIPLFPPVVNIQDSLVIKDGMGELAEAHYGGILPAADGPGIQYELDVWKQEKSNEGVFWLSTTYLGDEGEDDHSFITEGRLQIINRLYEGNNEVIYSLAPLDGSTPLYFVVDGDDLTMLDRQMGHISSASNHNYTLQRK